MEVRAKNMSLNADLHLSFFLIDNKYSLSLYSIALSMVNSMNILNNNNLNRLILVILSSKRI